MIRSEPSATTASVSAAGAAPGRPALIPADGVRLRVGVVGSGISGTGAAWLLSQRHHVTLFEAEARVGGHTHTVDLTLDGLTWPVDTGFLVFNTKTYPHLCGLLGHLGLDLAQTTMGFSFSRDKPDLEWAGTNLATVFAQPGNLLRPAFLGMVRDILRFNRETTAMAAAGTFPDCTLGEFLDSRHFGASLRDLYLLPMAASIWSCPKATMLAFPLRSFVQFCHNHHLLQVEGRPQWLTVHGGARQYLRRMHRDIPVVRAGARVEALRRLNQGVELVGHGFRETFDAVVLACHSDQALAILGEEATEEERDVLAAVRYQPNRALLHSDPALLPRRRKVWSAWNYLAGEGASTDRDGEAPVAVSYLINRLQPLPFERPVVVTLNPFREPDPALVWREIHYAHPVFDAAAIAAQSRLPAVQGRDRLWFAGAWTGYGFHEDGLRSAVHVARDFGVAAPWPVARGGGAV
ncbi:MAG: NAD/FAD-binding protein [Rhodocyclaceae bacterium]|nr:NAD/FAD-binding protein [Rhodocyclaceae bacterium]